MGVGPKYMHLALFVKLVKGFGPELLHFFIFSDFNQNKRIWNIYFNHFHQHLFDTFPPPMNSFFFGPSADAAY